MLNKQEIKKLIDGKKLIEGWIDAETQLTPNGFDLTAGKIYKFDAAGAVDFSNKERIVPEGKELIPKKKNISPSGCRIRMMFSRLFLSALMPLQSHQQPLAQLWLMKSRCISD